MLKSDAIEFLENVLSINGVETKLKFNKVELMREVCLKVLQNIPFQNLTMLATDPSERHLPTAEDVRDAYFSKVGGVCYSGANFAQQLFEAMGYEAFLIGCHISHTVNGKLFSHSACIVKEVSSSEERYFIDFAAGFPTFEPIPLHLLPQFYTHAFLEYKFMKIKDGTIARLHKVDPNKFIGKLPGEVEEGWQSFYHFEEIPRTKDFLVPYQEPIYTVPGYGSWFLLGLKISIYPENEALSICDYDLKKWKKGIGIEMVHLGNDNELEDAIKNYFPMLANVDIRKALFNWKRNKLFSATENVG